MSRSISRATPAARSGPRWLMSWGRAVVEFLEVLGRGLRATWAMSASDLRVQLGRVSLSALPLVGVAAFFIGMVIALQASLQLGKLGMNYAVVDAVALSVTRELAPIFTALLMAGKAGAGLASELGMVTLSGQAQAMRAMSLDIDRALIAPRIWSCIIGTLMLTAAAILLGILGGMVLGATRMGIDPTQFLGRVAYTLSPEDFACGLMKSVGFGVIIAGMGCMYGLRPKADAAALGEHTMKAVVMASFVVLVSNHVFTTLIVAAFA